MRKRIFSWLGKEFIELSGEARAGASVADETNDLFRRFEEELKAHGLSLEQTVRTRIWGRDREVRNLATAARSKILTSSAKASSSSYISPRHFDSDAKVALDLLAMKPSHPGAERKPVEFDPPRNYLCYLRYDSVLFFSGFTSSADTLEDQVPEIVETLAGALALSGVLSQDWKKVGKLSLFLHRSQKLDVLKDLLAKANMLDVHQVEFGFVDGYAGERSLLEVEATAVIGS